jgi:DNA (cytosine-5)-methyltransferase 1
MTRPIGVDLFSGAGGMTLGFEQAGFDMVAAVEIDPIHAAVHKFNFPDCAVLPISVRGLSGDAVRKAAKIGKRRVDVVVGGAPCQGFSLIGQRALDDPRNVLVKDFVRLVSELDASYFVFENVKGLTLGSHRKFLDELIGALRRRGYHVRLPWQVLNAASYGVPQDRERLILLGAKKGLELPQYPQPGTRPAGSPGDLNGLPEGPSVRQALGDLPSPDLYEALKQSDEAKGAKWGKPSAYSRELRCLANEAWHYAYPRDWDPSILTSSLRTEHTAISKRRFRETPAGQIEPISRFFKLPPEGIANTLRAGTDASRGAFTSPRPIHYEEPRCVTVREMARLHGFPDWFRFHETKWHGARQVGNAVAPPMARHIGEAILRAMRKRPEMPERTLQLNDPTLLKMGMAEAAAYFGIDKPIRGRDRKSGARKRKQEEIEAQLAAAE